MSSKKSGGRRVGGAGEGGRRGWRERVAGEGEGEWRKTKLKHKMMTSYYKV